MDDWLSKLLGVERITEGKPEVDFLNFPPIWLFVLFIVPAVFIIFYAIYRRERADVGAVPKAILTTVRGMIIVLILLMIFGPVLRVKIELDRDTAVIVLVDNSKSMENIDFPLKAEQQDIVQKFSGKDPKKTTRLDISKGLLNSTALDVIKRLEEKKLRVSVHEFSRLPEKVEREKIGDIKTFGDETAIGDSIMTVINKEKGAEIAGVILVSDGRNNTGRDPVDVAKNFCKQRGFPIAVIMPGFPQSPKDIEAKFQESPVRNITKQDKLGFKIRLSSKGFDREQTVMHYVERKVPDGEIDHEPPKNYSDVFKLISEAGSRTIKTETMDLSSAEKIDVKRFEYAPKDQGTFDLIVLLESKEGELSTKNNFVIHRLRVSDDKYRILYVESQPRFEFHFLMNALVRDNRGRLGWGLLLSADPDWPQPKPQSEGKEIRYFPDKMEDLLDFDVLIIGDIHPTRDRLSRHMSNPEVLEMIKKFAVDHGRGVIFIAGDKANPREFKGTPLEELLPFSLESSPSVSPGPFDREIKYQLEPEALDHPITRDVDPKKPNSTEEEIKEYTRKMWEKDIPSIFWYRSIIKDKKDLKPTAGVLVSVKGRAMDHASPLPLILYGRAGLGRVLFMATDETWRWRKLKGDAPWFYPFWGRAMDWVQQGKNTLSGKRITIELDKEKYLMGEEVKITAKIYNESIIGPRDEKEWDAFIYVPGKEEVEKERVTLEQDKDDKVIFRGQYKPKKITEKEPFRIEIEYPNKPDKAIDKFHVSQPAREEEHPILDEEMLKDIAKGSDGKFYRIDSPNLKDLHNDFGTIAEKLKTVRQDELWDAPLFYLLFALLITSEWVIRKFLRLL